MRSILEFLIKKHQSSNNDFEYTILNLYNKFGLTDSELPIIYLRNRKRRLKDTVNRYRIYNNLIQIDETKFNFIEGYNKIQKLEDDILYIEIMCAKYLYSILSKEILEYCEKYIRNIYVNTGLERDTEVYITGYVRYGELKNFLNNLDKLL